MRSPLGVHSYSNVLSFCFTRFINLTSNFRIFMLTINLSSCLACLRFVIAVTRACTTCSDYKHMQTHSKIYHENNLVNKETHYLFIKTYLNAINIQYLIIYARKSSLGIIFYENFYFFDQVCHIYEHLPR